MVQEEKSLNDAPWDTLSLRRSRPISASLLTLVRAPAGYLQGTCTTPDSYPVMEIQRRSEYGSNRKSPLMMHPGKFNASISAYH